MTTEEALERTRTLAPQVKVEMQRGLYLRRTKGGLPVLTIHYSANPERDPDQNPEWKKAARKTYSSQGAWDREQEIVDEAGGGELVFAETLRAHWDKIVITDPSWKPSKHWKVLGGFDHGKTNPTCLERAYVDHDGCIIFCGEYYMPGKQVWEHAPELLALPDVDRFDSCFSDPTVFDATHQQLKGEAKAINDLYCDLGVSFLSPFNGNRNDITFAARVLQHWANLDEREPTLKIVCRNSSEQPQPGRHDWDCPNLLWELLRTRKEKLTAQQLMTRNPSERIVDKDNHARDSFKYVVMSLPEPTDIPRSEVIRAVTKGLDPTSAMIRIDQLQGNFEREDRPVTIGLSPRRQRMLARLRR